MSKTFLFQAIQISLLVPIETIQFRVRTVLMSKTVRNKINTQIKKPHLKKDSQ